MTVTLESRLEAPLSGPLDSQPANPLGAFDAVDGRPSREFAQIAAEGRSRDESRRLAPAPREREAQQYLDDVRNARLDQARALTTTNPRSVIAYSRLAQVLLGLGDVEGSIAAGRHAIELHQAEGGEPGPAEAMALFVAARSLVVAGALDEAEALLERLDGRGPWALLSAAIAQSRGDTSLALTRLERDESFDAAAFRGYLRLEANEPQQGLAELRQARRVGSDSPSLLLNLAYAYACVGSIAKAIRSAQHAVRLAPLSTEASFNLASYLRAAGRDADAIKELHRLRREVGEGEPLIASALAEVYFAIGRTSDALRELRRAQHHHDLPLDSPVLAELRANTALLQWKLGEKTRAALVQVVQEQILKAGPQVSLVTMLADLLEGREASRAIRQYYQELVQTTAEDELAPLLVRLRISEGDVEGGARLAIDYANRYPLDRLGVRSAVVLQAQVFGEYSAAADAGLAALRRAPGDSMLRNNVAFCLVLAGRANEAASLFADFRLDDPFLLATRGMIAFAQRKMDEGLEWYDKAAEVARNGIANEEEADAFVRLLRAYEFVSLRELDRDSTQTLEALRQLSGGPESWPAERSYAILRKVLERMPEG